MAVLGQITLDELLILSVDSDPALSSTVAPIGSIATLDDNTNGRMWLKTGAADSAWSLIPRQANATSYATGGLAFADPSGNLIVDVNNIYWDNTNNRLALGANSPIVPQSTIHLDRGTGIGVHIRMTAGATTGQASGDGTEIGIDDTGAAEIRQYENSNINFYTNNLVRGSFTNDGKFILGGLTGIDITGAAAIPQFQIQGTAAVQMAGLQYSNDTIGPVFNIIKSRGATIGTHTIVQSGDEFGRIQFRASDGTNFMAGASIRALVDGAPGTGSMPGYMIFMTTPTGTTLPVERLRLDSTGQAIFAANIRLGNGADTTNGNLRYDGTEMLSRIAGAWRVVSATPITNSSTTGVTTTSGTYQVLTETQQTPPAGTYMVSFWCNASGTGSGRTNIALHIAGAIQTDTICTAKPTLSFGTSDWESPLFFTSIITLNGSQQIDVRYNRITAGTSGIGTRRLILIPLTR